MCVNTSKHKCFSQHSQNGQKGIKNYTKISSRDMLLKQPSIEESNVSILPPKTTEETNTSSLHYPSVFTGVPVRTHYNYEKYITKSIPQISECASPSENATPTDYLSENPFKTLKDPNDYKV